MKPHGAMRRRVGDPLRIVGYVRSSPREEQTMLGPGAQWIAIGRWVAGAHAELVHREEDIDISGAVDLERRPGLLAAIQALSSLRAGVLLVAKRDRLARDAMNAAMIERLVERVGARVLSADGVGNGQGPEAELLRGMVDLFAQYERALIRARTRAAMDVKRRRGEYLGQTPYGYRLAADKVRLEPDPEEQATIARVIDLHHSGVSQVRIARRLRDDGVPARGERWQPTTIARIIARDKGRSRSGEGPGEGDS